MIWYFVFQYLSDKSFYCAMQQGVALSALLFEQKYFAAGFLVLFVCFVSGLSISGTCSV